MVIVIVVVVVIVAAMGVTAAVAAISVTAAEGAPGRSVVRGFGVAYFVGVAAIATPATTVRW